jgi:hypothetical protein
MTGRSPLFGCGFVINTLNRRTRSTTFSSSIQYSASLHAREKKDVHYYSSDTEEFILSAAWLLLLLVTIHVLQNTWLRRREREKSEFFVMCDGDSTPKSAAARLLLDFSLRLFHF